MILDKIKEYPIILGSQSPRRCELLKALDIDFQVIVKSVDESIPAAIALDNAAEYIALKKLDVFNTIEFKNHLVITADTIVLDHTGRVLGKPSNREEARSILHDLSGNKHKVFTGVGLLFKGQIYSFTCATEVMFDVLTAEEINYYIDNYKPFDKAGSYGIQEWIGRIGILCINGSYENVMGLPTNRLYKVLKEIEKGL